MPDDVRDALADEQERLGQLLQRLGADGWGRPTRSTGWDVRAQVGHLSWFDRCAATVLDDAAQFAAEVARHDAAPEAYARHALEWAREADPTSALRRWHTHAAALRGALARRDQSDRIDWFGHPMSVRTLATARYMETWAHGLDVFEALEETRAESDAVSHIAHLGCRTRAYSFRIHGLDPPEAPVRVDLVLPSGRPWSDGPQAAHDRVVGDAVSFCLLVTQRRHRADLRLEAFGDVADRWLSVAQAFAGPPGPGRPPAVADVTGATT